MFIYRKTIQLIIAQQETYSEYIGSPSVKISFQNSSVYKNGIRILRCSVRAIAFLLSNLITRKLQNTKVLRRKQETTKTITRKHEDENVTTRKYDDENTKVRWRKTRMYDDEDAKIRWRKLENNYWVFVIVV